MLTIAGAELRSNEHACDRQTHLALRLAQQSERTQQEFLASRRAQLTQIHSESNEKTLSALISLDGRSTISWRTLDIVRPLFSCHPSAYMLAHVSSFIFLGYCSVSWCFQKILARWAIIIVSLCTHEYARSHSRPTTAHGPNDADYPMTLIVALIRLDGALFWRRSLLCWRAVCSTFMSCSSIIHHQSLSPHCRHHIFHDSIVRAAICRVKMHKHHLISELNSIDFGLNEINRPL